MATTINIPLVTIPVGTQTFGPVTIGTPFTSTVLTLDRTVSNGLNANASTIISYMVQASPDGTTWTDLTGSTTTGGILEGDGGVTVTSQVDSINWTTPRPAGRFRVRVTIQGHAVAVAGSFVAS